MTMTEAIPYADWHIPLSQDGMTLRQAAALLATVGAMPDEIPLMVRLAENPQFDLFTGAVDLKTHDYIHPLLGRGLLAKDEAFVVGFTMGSTHKLGAAEEKLFTLVAQHLYPGIYRFSDEDARVFRDAVRLAFLSDCRALNKVDYQPYLDRTLADIRRELGIEPLLLQGYYTIEKRRYPHSPESQRLLDRTVVPMPRIESSAISHVNYQDQRRLLYVTYKGQGGQDSGGSYVYVGVPRRDYDDLLKAESKGTFINERIKPKYKCQRLGEA